MSFAKKMHKKKQSSKDNQSSFIDSILNRDQLYSQTRPSGNNPGSIVNEMQALKQEEIMRYM